MLLLQVKLFQLENDPLLCATCTAKHKSLPECAG